MSESITQLVEKDILKISKLARKHLVSLQDQLGFYVPDINEFFLSTQLSIIRDISIHGQMNENNLPPWIK